MNKKDNASSCKNYRPIAVLAVAYKILEITIKKPTYRDYRMNIFILRQIMDNSIDQSLSVYMICIDIKRAYNTVKRKKVYEAMKQLKMPNKYINC